jgi:hypothetical protein
MGSRTCSRNLRNLMMETVGFIETLVASRPGAPSLPLFTAMGT